VGLTALVLYALGIGSNLKSGRTQCLFRQGRSANQIAKQLRDTGFYSTSHTRMGSRKIPNESALLAAER
ncbi:MAG: hypothetical protein WBV18_00340, partial [Methyloceanibacter sp.]|uniref:hypothetical protein n=1 Tax=Methyloceanibacter sp. TaxID=1965321 RepID=UPI003C3366C5